MNPETLRAQLLRDEGLRLKVYNDSKGIPTIGVGRNLRDKGLSLAEAEYLLDNDIRDATSDVVSRIPWSYTLDPIRFEVLVNLSFNLGVAGLLAFAKMLAALEAGRWDDASTELLDSKYAKQVGRRADRLATQIRTGERQ